MNLFTYYLFTYVISLYQLKCFLMSSEIWKEYKNIKYRLKRHIASLEHCFSCKLSPAYSLYFLKLY